MAFFVEWWMKKCQTDSHIDTPLIMKCYREIDYKLAESLLSLKRTNAKLIMKKKAE